MKVEVDLTEYGVKAPKWYDPINPHVINASGGSGGSNDVELTWEEYEALSEEEKMNGSNYFITDIGNPKSLTSKVLFSNSVSANTDYTLSDSYKNYDFIKIDIGLNANNNVYKSLILPKERYGNVNTIFAQYDYAHSTASWAGNYYASCSFNFSNDTTIHTTSSDTTFTSGWSSNYIVITGYRYERVVVPNQMVNYSTVEQRIGTWIDGKPLYQKSFIFNYSDLNTNNTIKYTPGINSSMISNLKETISVDGILITNNYGAIPIGSKGYAMNNDTSTYIEVPKYYSCIGIIVQGQGINLQNEFNKLYVTVRYTKTTD